MYISSTNTLPGDGDQPVASDLRDAFEEVFRKYKVGGGAAAGEVVGGGWRRRK